MTNGWTNWYRVVRSSRSVGENSPADQSSGYGTEVNLGSGAPATTANRCASSRTVSGGVVGTRPPFPPAPPSGGPRAPRVRGAAARGPPVAPALPPRQGRPPPGRPP